MFERADRLWLSQVESSLPYHALDYSWQGFEPTLLCVDRTCDAEVSIDLEEVDYVIGERRECVGQFENGQHKPCPNHESVSRFTQCAGCAEESFIPYQECVFEPKCDGELCEVEFCRREHVLYLAFYNTRAKIGMSSSRRLEERLIEQGADAYAMIASYPTRKSAREAEKEISAKLRIPQSFRQKSLLDGLARRVDANGIEDSFADICASLGSMFGLEPKKLEWLESYPIELPLEHRPTLRETSGRHKGKAMGVKGRWLIYRSTGIKALSLADVPSRFIGTGRIS